MLGFTSFLDKRQTKIVFTLLPGPLLPQSAEVQRGYTRNRFTATETRQLTVPKLFGRREMFSEGEAL